MSSTLVYSALAACCLALSILALATLGGGSYMFVMFGVVLSVVLASFAYESYRPEPIEAAS